MTTVPENSISSMADFYAAVADENHPRREEFVNILQHRNTLTSALRFDPRTNGVGCTGSLDLVRNRLKRQAGHGDEFHDCPSQLAGFVLPAVRHIAGNLRTAITRSYEMHPPHEAGELDAACIRNLSRRPGRTAVEKIQHAREILTLRRTFTADTLENRLFKEFAVRFLSLLQVRERALQGMWPEQPSSPCSQIMHLLRGWLHSPEGASISPWRNEPPNNVLLADAHYNKIWIAYQKLSAMDAVAESEANDKSCVQRLASGAFLVTFLQHLWEDKGDIIHVSQCPLFIEYYNPRCIIQDVDIPVYVAKGGAVKRHLVSIANGCVYIDGSNVSREKAERMAISKLHFMLARNYAIRVKKGKEGEKSPDTHPGREAAPAQNPPAAGKREAQWDSSDLFNHRDTPKKDADKTVVFDLRYSCSYPRYSDGGGNAAPLWLVAQIWETEQGPQLLDCDGCTALQVPADGEQRIRTFSMKDVLGGESVPVEVLNLFARKIAAAAEGYRPVVILPDSVDDFTLADFRRALNLACPAVEYLPHSVASVYAWLLQRGELDKRTEFAVRSVQGKSVFESIVRVKELDHALKKMFPETQGVLWELVPSSEIGEAADVGDSLQCFERDEVDELARHGVEFVFDFGSETSSPAGGKVRFPPSSDKSEARPLAANHCFTGVESSYIVRDIYQGALLWNACRRKFPDKVLWSVCLPPLSTHLFSAESACWVDYFFVEENAGSIIPKRGLECSVPKKSSKFKLACGQSRFAFPLKLGSRDTMYEAVLSLPQTLNNDLSGSFEVKYTFGDSQPYCMRFIPDRADADSIPCAIRVADLRDDSKHVPPPFRKKSLDLVRKGIEVHKGYCTKCSDREDYAFIRDSDGNSVYCHISDKGNVPWPLEKNETYYCTVKRTCMGQIVWEDMGTLEDVYSKGKDRLLILDNEDGKEQYVCHESIYPADADIGDEIHVLYTVKGDSSRAIYVGKAQDIDVFDDFKSKHCARAVFCEENTCIIDNYYYCKCNSDVSIQKGDVYLIANLRYQVNCLSSSKDALFVRNLICARKYCNDGDALKRLFPDFAWSVGRDMSNDRIAAMFPALSDKEQRDCYTQIMQDKEQRQWRENVVMAIGDAASDVQKKMLRRICGELYDDKRRWNAYHVLARLVVRCDGIREQLGPKTVENMLKQVKDHLDGLLEEARINAKKPGAYIDSTPFNALFWLMRFRGSGDTKMRGLVSSSSSLMKEIIKLVEDLQKVVAGTQIQLKSSVRLQDSVMVPKGAHPLLYVLHHYLNSESGEMNITLQEED